MATKAWMIRNDGKTFDVEVHPYGNRDIEFIEETIYAAEWLYSHTNHVNVKDNIIKFIASYADQFESEESRYDCLKNLIEDRPYKWLSMKFLNDNKDKINESDGCVLNDMNNLICDELDQEFLRSRAGGAYNSSSNLGDIYFRISSSGFNWFNIIYEFVYSRKSSINTVTIIRDDESGIGDTLYYNHNNVKFNKLSIDDFITISGNPVVESSSSVINKLNSGKSLFESFNGINIKRILNNKNIIYSNESVNFTC